MPQHTTSEGDRIAWQHAGGTVDVQLTHATAVRLSDDITHVLRLLNKHGVWNTPDVQRVKDELADRAARLWELVDCLPEK